MFKPDDCCYYYYYYKTQWMMMNLNKYKEKAVMCVYCCDSFSLGIAYLCEN